MKLSNQRKGELFVFSNSLLWALFPVIAVLSYNTLAPVVYLLFSIFISVFFFAAIMWRKNLWQEVFNRAAFKNILMLTLILGVVYYLLVFLGLKYTSPGNASIVALTQIFFSFLFFSSLSQRTYPNSTYLGWIINGSWRSYYSCIQFYFVSIWRYLNTDC